MTKEPVREVTLDEFSLCHVGNVGGRLICEVGVWINPVQTDWGASVSRWAARRPVMCRSGKLR